MTYSMKMKMKMKMEKQSSIKSSRSGTLLGMHRGSRVNSKLQPPKIRIIHIFPPEIIETDEANFRDLVQSLTGKHAKKGKSKGKRVKQQEAQAQAMISCDNPTVVVNPKIEVMTMDTPGSSTSSDHQYSWRPSSSLSSGDDHDHDHQNNIISSCGGEGEGEGEGGYLLTLDEVDDVFDFTSMFNMDLPLHHHTDASSNHLNPFGQIIL